MIKEADTSSRETLVMSLRDIRFTIRSLMIAVAIVAGLLTLSNGYGLIILACGLPCLSVIGSQWLVLRGHRLIAAFGFWSLAILANLSYVAFCVAPDIYLLIALFLGWLVIVGPSLGALGVAWARLATQQGSAPRRSQPTAWVSVITQGFLPLVTLWTVWPLHLAFFTFKPALERLADQVAAGKAGSFPQWVGPFRVARSAVDPVSGNVGLMTDPNPNGPSGLVRVRPGVPPNRDGPFGWDDLGVDLGWGWEYREED
jgi:hypothetical protein